MTRPTSQWYLEGYAAGSSTLLRIPIASFPFRIGRASQCTFAIRQAKVSSQHAEIVPTDGGLLIRDLQSTNGTFVNRERLTGERILCDGDILHFADLEYRLVFDETEVSESSGLITKAHVGDLPQRLVAGTRQFRELLRTKAVTAKFQPIVTIDGATTIGYEVLGRGAFPELPIGPGPLFEIAASLELQAELSRLFRRVGIAMSRDIPGKPRIFVNTDPTETKRPGLVESLKEIRIDFPRLDLVLELHEAAVTDLAEMSRLRAVLSDLGIGLAYDDFGSGQARLLELVEVPPDILKFDIGLIRDIHLAPPTKQQMLGTLVKMVADMGITTLAEGIEARAEADLCAELGFALAQGYFFGRPADPPTSND